MEFSHGWSSLCTAASGHHEGRLHTNTFHFCTFRCYQNFGTLPHYGSLRVLIWKLILSCTCLNFLHTKPRPVTLCLFSFAAFYTVDWPKDGCVKSWVANIQFDSTTCAWDEMFDSHFLCTYMSTNHPFAFCLSHVRALSVKILRVSSDQRI